MKHIAGREISADYARDTADKPVITTLSGPRLINRIQYPRFMESGKICSGVSKTERTSDGLTNEYCQMNCPIVPKSGLIGRLDEDKFAPPVLGDRGRCEPRKIGFHTLCHFYITYLAESERTCCLGTDGESLALDRSSLKIDH